MLVDPQTFNHQIWPPLQKVWTPLVYINTCGKVMQLHRSAFHKLNFHSCWDAFWSYFKIRFDMVYVSVSVFCHEEHEAHWSCFRHRLRWCTRRAREAPHTLLSPLSLRRVCPADAGQLTNTLMWFSLSCFHGSDHSWAALTSASFVPSLGRSLSLKENKIKHLIPSPA